MKDKLKDKLISAQLKAILTGLSVNGINHLSEIETDLFQINLLQEEAMAKLIASFMAINGAISVHQEMLGAFEEQLKENDNVSGLLAVSEELGRHINDVVTSLQFEDMTRQLIERAIKRAAGLRGILASLGSSSDGIGESLGGNELPTLLRSLNKQIELQNNELNEVLRKTVRQKHMDSGDAELF